MIVFLGPIQPHQILAVWVQIPVIENNPNTLGLGLDESTAMIVEAGKFKIWGLSYAMLYDPKDWAEQKKQWGRVVKPFKMMSSGETYNLVTRKIEPSLIATD